MSDWEREGERKIMRQAERKREADRQREEEEEEEEGGRQRVRSTFIY